MFQFENSAVESFYKTVQGIPTGTLITYPQFADMGWNLRNGGRRLVYSANRVLRENDLKMLINKRNEGYVMAEGKQQMDHAWERKKRARNQVSKAVHEVTYLNTSELSAEDRKTLTDREIYLTQQLRTLRKRNIAAQKVAKQAIGKVEKSVEIQQESLSRIDQLIAEASEIRKRLKAS